MRVTKAKPVAVLVAASIALLASVSALALDPTRPLARYGHEVWQDDLPQNTVHTIVQTRDGFLWLGTYEGLVRFDGVEFRVFDKQNTPQLRGNGIRALYEDRNGTLWIGTTGSGLVSYAAGTFTTYLSEQGLANDFVYAMAEDAEGALWVGTNGGLSRFEDNAFRSVTGQDGLSSDHVRAVAVDRDGTLWVGTDRGLDAYRDGRITHYGANEGLPDGTVTALREDSGGALWVGTDGGGVSRFADGRFTTFTTADGLSSNRVWTLYEDREGNLWIGTDGGGLNRYHDGRFSSRSLDEGLSDTFVRTICEDHEGSLWIGTNGGLNRLKDSKFIAYTTRDGLSNNFARVVAEDTSGAVWVGTDGGGLNRLEEDRVTVLSKQTGFPSDFVRALCPAPDGGMWVGTVGGGVCRVAGDRVAGRYTTADGLASDDVRALCLDAEGDLWVGTSGGGVSRLANGRFTTYTTREGLGTNDVRAILAARDGTIWIGTNGGGISRFANGVLKTYGSDQGLASDVVFALHEDEDGLLWIGTNSGLTLYDGTFHTLTTDQGLFDDIAFQILEDGAGNLWMSCNKGVYRVSRRDLLAVARGEAARVTPAVYGKADGMGSTQCNGASQPAGWRGRDGRLWFPTVMGVAVVDPNNIKLNTVAPPVTIDRVVVDGIGISNGAELEASSRRFEFHYEGLSFVVPAKVRFKYRLEGLDPDWIDAGTRRAAYYNNLPPGSYTFRIQACNNDGVWNEAGASFAFVLPPPLWKTWWAYALYALAIGGFVVGVHRLRLRALHHRNETLEAEVASRTSQLAESEHRALEASRAKSTFLANMSHELRTPLNAILGFVQLMKRDRGLNAEQRENVGIIERSGQHLLSLINDVLSISKIEAGHVALNEQAFDLPRMLANLRETFRLKAEAQSLTFQVEATGLQQYVVGDEPKLRQILINLLGNAFKFTERGGVVMRASWRDARAVFEVEDTGPGIAREDREKLFGAFVQTATGVRSQEGTGLGLAISRSYARLMHGDITVESEVGRGTVFRVEISLPATDAATPEPIERPVVGIELGQPLYRILVVDDTLENRRLLVKLLSSVGFQVREAANGREAVEQWARWRPHLIWMDIRMPVLDGVSATREIRAREGAENGAACKIVALTASVFDTEHESVLSAGCDDLLTKPFKEATIFEKLAEHLGVRFIYERTGRTGPLRPVEDDRALTPARLAALPPDLLGDLGRAVHVGDVESIHETINRICDCDEPLGNELRELARRYQFEEILASVERAEVR